MQKMFNSSRHFTQFRHFPLSLYIYIDTYINVYIYIYVYIYDTVAHFYTEKFAPLVLRQCIFFHCCCYTYTPAVADIIVMNKIAVPFLQLMTLCLV